MNWPEVIGGAAGAAIARAIVDVWKSVRREKLKLPSRSLNSVTEIYTDGLKPILTNSNAERVMISKIHDSGGPIVPGADVFLSMVYEDYEKTKTPVMDLFQKWRPDKYYIEMLLAVCKNGSAIVDISKLPNDSKQRGAETSIGVRLCEVYFIAQTKSVLYIATIGTSSEAMESNPLSRLYIDASIAKLRDIFKRYH